MCPVEEQVCCDYATYFKISHAIGDEVFHRILTEPATYYFMNQEQIEEKLKTIKGLILDGDGVFFTGQEMRSVMPDGSVMISKERSLRDGQGLSFMRGIGLRIVFATGEGEPLSNIVEKLNNLPSVTSGAWQPITCLTGLYKKAGKVESLEAWLVDVGLTWEDCAYIGDDRTDFEAMKFAGLKVVPLNAHRVVSNIADLQLKAGGGNGAIREFAEMVLDARGIDEATLPSA
jgi:3-deoxy-D-manno-octulosonate 8-phosphate phosphatase KdsC-like HAD superfamily phosphatase